MNPSESLNKILALAKNIINNKDNARYMNFAFEAERLAELVLLLNKYLTDGGMPPQKWKSLQNEKNRNKNRNR